jgi:putative transcriptional regulator
VAEDVLSGKLLIANPRMVDPNFDRTVVLVLAHGDEGAIGVVLNRPSETEVGEPLPGWESLAVAPSVVFMGGPVNHSAAICLARLSGGQPGLTVAPGDAGAREGWTSVSGEVGTFDLELDPEAVAAGLSGLRIFAGYAGWAAGQLEGEIDAGAWWVVEAESRDVFSDRPEQLWGGVLRRQGGSLALVAHYPADPHLN